MWWVIAFIIIDQHKGPLTLSQGFSFKGAFKVAMQDLSVADQFHLCIATVANQSFCCIIPYNVY